MKLATDTHAIQTSPRWDRDVAEVTLSAGLEVKQLQPYRDENGGRWTRFLVKAEWCGWVPHKTFGAVECTA